MPTVSLPYSFRQPLRVPARTAYAWCTDFGPDDGKLFSSRTKRSVWWLTEDALVMTDTTYSRGAPRRIRRLVRLDPATMAWTNTHLDGPYRHSQFWYRIIPDDASRCHLEFRGLRLEASARLLTPTQRNQRAELRQRSDAREWERRFAPALERDVR